MRLNLCPINRPHFMKVMLFILFFSAAETLRAQAKAYLKLPLKRLEFADGSSQCGYYDEVNKKLIGCKGELLAEKVVYVRMYSGDYCCSVEANEGRLGEGIEFKTGTAVLTGKSLERLNYVVNKVREYPTFKIAIEVHTDNTGSATNNMVLSEKRATVIKDYMIKQGVIPQRLEAKGYGEERPIADNSTEAGRARNRRVEINIVN